MALLQVGVIVAAVLAAGICHRVWMGRGWPPPPLVALLCGYGVVGLLVPLTWVTGAAVLHIRPGVSEDLRVLMFWLGVLVLIALAAFALYADVSPWLVFLENAGDAGDGGGD